MSWSPAFYKQFKALISMAPFTDLLGLVAKKPNLRVVDLGCGNGEFTRILADTLPKSDVTGVDSSPEMLQEAHAHTRQGLHFQVTSIEEVATQDTKWDLVFSNTVMQWVDDHRTLLPKLVARIAPGGQLAMQIPAMDSYYFMKELGALASLDPFRSLPWPSTVLSSEEYATILHQSGGADITALEKVYPYVVKDVEVVIDFAFATGLIYYLRKLPLEQHEAFKEEYKKTLRRKYPQTPLFFPHKRLFLVATFPATKL